MAAKDYVCRYDKVIFCAWFDGLYLLLLLHLWYLARVALFNITDLYYIQQGTDQQGAA